MKPRVLDLFCGPGGTTRGYQDAGCYVVGVDHLPQPNYCGDEFHKADALNYPLEGFDLIHASPPCQFYSVLGSLQRHGPGYPNLIPNVQRMLDRSGVPFVIENVVGARRFLRSPVQLCGSSFGLGVRRHRLFECSFPVMVPPCQHYLQPEPIDVTGLGGPGGRHRKPRDLAHAREVMGIAWMTRAELSQAIPPVFTEYLASQFLAQVPA